MQRSSGFLGGCSSRVLLAAVAVFLVAMASPKSLRAQGNNVVGCVGGFEIDGNLLPDTSTALCPTVPPFARLDWIKAFDGLSQGVIDPTTCRPIPPPEGIGALFERDANWVGSTVDSVFRGQSNKNNDNIAAGASAWHWVLASGGPGKDDITEVYEASIADLTQEVPLIYLLLGAAVRETNGDKHLDFEINVAGIRLMPDGTIVGFGPDNGRTTGADKLISVDYESGGARPTFNFYHWQIDHYEPDSIPPIDPVTGAINFLAATNFNPAPTPCGATESHSGEIVPAYEPLQFVEFALNIEFFGIPQSALCSSQLTTMVKTRSSSSFSAELKDFAFLHGPVIPRPECPPQDVNICQGDSAVICGDPGGSHYRWTTGDTTECIIVRQPGQYCVTFLDPDGCERGPCCFNVTVSGPDCSINGRRPLCAGDTASYCATVTPAGGTVAFAWSITGDGTIVSDPTASCVTVQSRTPGGTGDGSFTLSLDVTRDNCRTAQPCTFVVPVNRIPIATIIKGDDALCAGDSSTYCAAVTPAGGTVTYEWSITGSGAFVTPPTSTSACVRVRATGTTDGSFTLSVRVTRNGCRAEAPATRTVTVSPPPTCNIIKGDDALCLGDSSTYCASVSPAGGVVTYQWSITGNGAFVTQPTSSSACVTVRATGGAGTFTLSLRVTRNGCPGANPTCTRTVTVNQAPVATIIKGDDALCVGDSSTYCAQVSPAGLAVTYTWSITGNGEFVTPPTSSSTCVTVRATGPGDGSFQLCLDVMPSTGCPAARTCRTVIVNAIPVATIIKGDPSLCVGDSSSYCAAVTPAGGTVTYQWSISGNGVFTTPPTSASPCVTVRATGEGSFTLSLRVTRNGCPSAGPATKTVIVSPPPTCDIVKGPASLCSGDTASYCATVFPPGGVVTYQWSIIGNGVFVTPPTSTSACVTVRAVDGDGSFTLSLRVTRDGCPGANPTCTRTVTVNATPVATIIKGDASLCVADTSVYCAAVTPAGGTVTYAWTITGSGEFVTPPTSTSACVTVRATNPGPSGGSFTLSLRVTRNGCPDQAPATRTVTVTPPPICSISGSDPVCTNQQGIVYTATIPGGCSVVWTISGNGTIVGSTTGTSVIVNADGPGQFTLCIDLTCPPCPTVPRACCKTVTVSQVPTVTITGPDPVCTNQSGLVYTANVTPAGGVVTYAWSISGNGTIKGSTTGPTVTVNSDGEGSFTLSVSVTRDGCPAAGPATKRVTINPTPTCVINGPDAVCTNLQGVVYTATVSPSGGAVTYLWTVTGNATIVGPNNGPSVTLNIGLPGSFQLSLFVTRDGCPGGNPSCTKKVIVGPAPTCTINGPDPVCNNQQGVLYTATVDPPGGAVTYSWSISGNGVIVGPTNGPTVRVNVDGPGTFVLSLTIIRDGCPGGNPSCTKTVTVSPTPTVTISGPDPVCTNQGGLVYSANVLPTGGTVIYAWSISGNGFIKSPTNAPTVTVNADGAGSFTLSLTVTRDGCPAAAPATKIVTVNPTPICTINGPDLLCSNQQNVLYTATVTPSGGAVSYSWSISGNGTIVGPTNGPSVMVSADGPGAFILSLSVTRDGCPGGNPSCTKKVPVNAAPTCSINGPDPVCSNQQAIVYTATVSPPGGFVSYSWAISGNGTIVGPTNTSTVTVSAGAAGTFTLSLTIIRDGCSGGNPSCTKTVTVNPTPTVTITGPDPACSNQGGLVYTANVSPGGGTVIYAWSISGNGFIKSPTNEPTVTVNADGVGSFTLSVRVIRDGCPAAAPATKIVTVNPTPTCTINGPDVACSNQQVILYTATVLPSGGAVSYSWSITGNGTIVGPTNGPSVTVNADGPGAFILSLAVTRDGCPGGNPSCTKKVPVNAAPTCSINGPDPVCTNQQGLVYTATVSPPGGAVTFSWSISGNGTIVGPTNGSSVTVNADGPGTFTLNLNIIRDGCSGGTPSCTKTVTVSPTPTVTITGPDPVCTGQSGLVYTANVSPSGGVVTFSWSISGNGSIVGSTTGPSVTVNADGQGSFTLTVSVTRDGCPAAAPVTKTVTVSPPPVCSISGPDPVCTNRTGLVYTATVTPSGGTVTYSWSISGNGTIVGLTTGPSVTVNADGPGSFTLSLNVTRNGCPGASPTCTKRVTVGEPPVCTISGPPGICPGQSATLCGPDDPNLTYSWSPGGETSRCITTSVADQTYTLTITDRRTGCTSSCSFELVDFPEPPCEITATHNPICEGQSSTLCGPSDSNLNYRWSTGATSRCIDVSSPGTYTLTVTDKFTHCDKTCSIDIREGSAPVCVITGPATLPAGGTGQLCGPEGSDLAYEWSTGETSRCVTVHAGSFSLTVTDTRSGCHSSCSFTVREAPCECTVGYPDHSNPPRSEVEFKHQLALKKYTPCPQDDLILKAWYNSDYPIVLGVRKVTVKTSSGSKSTDYPVTSNSSSPRCVTDPQAGATGLEGDQAGTDKYGRPMYPALFVTDITDDPNSRSGDWQQKSNVAYPPTKICGTWKAVTRTLDKTSSPPKVTISADSNPDENDWDLGSGHDDPPGGLDALPTLGFGSEVAWDLRRIGLLPGHTYRLYFMLHKGKSDGDAAQACASVTMPPAIVAQSQTEGAVHELSSPLATDGMASLPKRFELQQNFPNPFNPTTAISYAVPERSEVRLAVYTVLGQEVATLVDGIVEPGYRTVPWRAVDRSGRPLPPGVYLYRMQAKSTYTGAYFQVRKMVLLK